MVEVRAFHHRYVAFAIMGNEIPAGIVGNRAHDGTLSRALDLEAGACSELRNRHDHQTGDATG
jgi:hypothetical protein